MRRNCRGLTLIEVLVVLFIVVLIAGVLIPVALTKREMDRRMYCRDNLRQIGLAMSNYHQQNHSLPPGWVSSNCFGWGTFTLPYYDGNGNVLEIIDFKQPWSSSRVEFFHIPLRYHRCPSDFASDQVGPPVTNAGAGRSNYAAVSGATPITGRTTIVGETGGAFGENSSRDLQRDFNDGLSHTFLVGERRSPNNNRQNPGGDTILVGIRDNQTQQGQALVIGDCSTGNLPNFRGTNSNSVTGFSSPHRGGVNFLFGDRSIRFISDKIDPTTYANLATIADGSSVDTNW